MGGSRREIWVVRARAWRNLETRLRADFDLYRDVHYEAIAQPTEFVTGLRARLDSSLARSAGALRAGRHHGHHPLAQPRPQAAGVRRGGHPGRTADHRRAAQRRDGQPAAGHPPGPARRGATAGATRQIHALATRKDLDAAEVCWRLSGRWREENYFRYARKTLSSNNKRRMVQSGWRRRHPPRRHLFLSVSSGGSTSDSGAPSGRCCPHHSKGDASSAAVDTSERGPTMGREQDSISAGEGRNMGDHAMAAPQRLPGAFSASSPSLSALCNVLHFDWKGAADSSICWSTTRFGSWPAWTSARWSGPWPVRAPGYEPDLAGSLTGAGGSWLAMVRRAAADQSAGSAIYDQSAWSAARQLPAAFAGVAAAAAYRGGKLTAAWRGQGADQRICWSVLVHFFAGAAGNRAGRDTSRANRRRSLPPCPPTPSPPVPGKAARSMPSWVFPGSPAVHVDHSKAGALRGRGGRRSYAGSVRRRGTSVEVGAGRPADLFLELQRHVVGRRARAGPAAGGRDGRAMALGCSEGLMFVAWADARISRIYWRPFLEIFPPTRPPVRKPQTQQVTPPGIRSAVRSRSISAVPAHMPSSSCIEAVPFASVDFQPRAYPAVLGARILCCFSLYHAGHVSPLGTDDTHPEAGASPLLSMYGGCATFSVAHAYQWSGRSIHKGRIPA